LIGRTLEGIRFRERYGVNVMAVNHNGNQVMRKLSSFRFHLGDILLVQGDRSDIDIMEQDEVFRIIQSVEDKPANLRRAGIAVVIFIGVIIAALVEIVPLAVAVLIGAVLAFITRCVTPDEAYRAVEWKALILIGSMLAVGTAMEQTGAAAFLAEQIANLVYSPNQCRIKRRR
jgi:di/tricarboxylate transporter